MPKVNPANPSGSNCVRIGSTKKLPPAIEVSKETLNLLLKARDDVKKQETLKVQAVAETSQVVKLLNMSFVKKSELGIFFRLMLCKSHFRFLLCPLNLNGSNTITGKSKTITDFLKWKKQSGKYKAFYEWFDIIYLFN